MLFINALFSCLSPRPSEKQRGFQLQLSRFTSQWEANSDPSISSIQEQLNIIKQTFSQEVRLKHPRDIYQIYDALNFVTDEVAKTSLSHLKNDWNQVLETLHQRTIYRIGLGYCSFDASIAQEILTKTPDAFKETVTITSIDLKNKKNYEEAVDYIFKTDREAFGSCFQRGFIEAILKSNRVKCLVARNHKNDIVGILWGFLADCQGTHLFHTWELSRKAPMARMGIARKLIDYAKHQQQSLYPHLKFATLNVDRQNTHAKQIYDDEHFEAFNKEEKDPKIFMINKLVEENIHLEPDLSKTLVKKFVMHTIPLYKLAYYELVRRCELIWRACWYR